MEREGQQLFFTWCSWPVCVQVMSSVSFQPSPGCKVGGEKSGSMYQMHCLNKLRSLLPTPNPVCGIRCSRHTLFQNEAERDQKGSTDQGNPGFCAAVFSFIRACLWAGFHWVRSTRSLDVFKGEWGLTGVFCLVCPWEPWLFTFNSRFCFFICCPKNLIVTQLLASL